MLTSCITAVSPRSEHEQCRSRRSSIVRLSFMAWRDVCRRGRPAGGRVRQDDVNRSDPPAAHDAGGASPGILIFIQEVIRLSPPWRLPEKPEDFPSGACRVETYPGHGAADVHFEGRAADVYLNYNDPSGRIWGDWLFDWCVDNCRIYQIQGVIFGGRQRFSETHGGLPFPRMQHDHYDHVHVELNGDGAALT